MITIHLKNLSFFSYHGIHEEEAITGTKFEIDVEARFQEGDQITRIDQTVNYVSIYRLVENIMKTPQPLLESIAIQLANDINKMDDRIKYVSIAIYKEHPPISNFSGKVGVTYDKEFDL